MRAIDSGSPRRGIRLNGVRRLRHGSPNGVAHRMVMMQRRRLRRRRPNTISLILHRVRSTVTVNSSHGGCSYRCPRLVRGVIEQCSNIVDEERVELLRDLLLVCEFKCSLKRDPESVRGVARCDLVFAYHTPLRCIGPILTTCLVFSLFNMPSRRPRVMPATLRSFVPLIMWLSDWY